MKIYVCDKCGHKEKFDTGIVGNEFDYYGPGHRDAKLHKRRRFETLAPEYRFGKWVDVCRPCFNEISSARHKAENETRNKTKSKMKTLLGI